MKYRLFGSKTGLYVSELVLGASMFGTAKGYGATPDEVKQILQAYKDAGGNFIDIADQYQLGEAEEHVGEFLLQGRQDFVISSKYTRTDAVMPGRSAMGNHRKAMIQSVERSLRRLKTDYIDIYFAHFDDGETPVEEIVRGFDDLARAGKIVYGGLANFPAWKATAAAVRAELTGVLPVAALQIEYNLLERSVERELLPMAQALGMGVMMYSPLAGGILTGKYRAGETGRLDKMSGKQTEDERTSHILDVLITIAQEMGINPGETALAWVLSKGHFPIVGARTKAQLDGNLRGLDINLSEEQIKRLDDASAVSLGYPYELLAAQQQLVQK